LLALASLDLACRDHRPDFSATFTFAIDARDHAGDEPARESHFYDDYESAILHKGGAADFAVVVGFLHMKLPSMTR
jgi:hypothetical protein